jgi:hypothetical protein
LIQVLDLLSFSHYHVAANDQIIIFSLTRETCILKVQELQCLRPNIRNIFQQK